MTLPTNNGILRPGISDLQFMHPDEPDGSVNERVSPSFFYFFVLFPVQSKNHVFSRFAHIFCFFSFLFLLYIIATFSVSVLKKHFALRILFILSQSRRLPPLQVASNSKFVSVGVGAPTETNAPRGCAMILYGICQRKKVKIP